MEVGGQLHDPGRFTPRERAPGSHWIGDWVGTRASLDAGVKSKFPIRCQDSKPRPSSPQPSAILLSYPGRKVSLFSDVAKSQEALHYSA